MVSGVVIVLKPFVQVVESPVESVDVNVGIVSLSSVKVTHVNHGIPGPLVADHGSAGTLAGITVDPRVVVHGTQVETVEGGHRGVFEDREVELSFSVGVAETHAHRVFYRLARGSTGTALKFGSAIDLESTEDVDSIRD